MHLFYTPDIEGDIYTLNADESRHCVRVLRLAFATHRLYRWMREGKDLNAMLPYLSAYMGHAQLSDTYYYIHLVPGLLEEMSGFAFSSAETFLPEVRADE